MFGSNACAKCRDNGSLRYSGRCRLIERLKAKVSYLQVFLLADTTFFKPIAPLVPLSGTFFTIDNSKESDIGNNVPTLTEISYNASHRY